MNKTLLMLLACACALSAGTVTLTLTPSAHLSGVPGSTTGWGFSVDNSTEHWLLVSAVTFTDPGTTGVFTPYLDYLGGISFAPGITSQEYDPVNGRGLAWYKITSTVAGASAFGSIQFDYSMWSADPNAGDADWRGDAVVSADASVTVEAAAVPEPATRTLLLLGGGLLVLGMAKRR